MQQDDSIPITQPTISPKGLSFRGLAEVFYKPAAFFETLKVNPKVLVPYLVYAIILFVFFVPTTDFIYDMQVNSPQFQERMQGQTLPPQAQQIMRYQIMFGGPIAFLLVPLLAAVLAVFWGNFVFAGKARFKQLLSVMLYGEIIFGLGMLVILPMVLAKKSILVSLSLAVLAAGKGPDSILYLALSKIDLFLIWEIIVIGIGLSIIYGMPRNKGYTLSILSMGMISILHVVFSAIGKLIF